MKSAEEWLTSPNIARRATEQDCLEWIKQIQIDAWKQGMTDAAEMVKQYDNRNDTWGGGLLYAKSSQIKQAAEQKTSI